MLHMPESWALKPPVPGFQGDFPSLRYGMTCQTLRSSATPKALTGWVLLDGNNVPRYWATVWADVLQAKLKDSTRSRCLYAIDRLYQHFALLHKPMSLIGF